MTHEGMSMEDAPNTDPAHISNRLTQLLTPAADAEAFLPPTETGYVALDVFELPSPPALIVVGSRPQIGRTTFLHNLARMNRERPTVIYSLDIPAAQVTLRFLAALSRVEFRMLHTGLTEREAERLAVAAGKLNLAELSIVDSYDMTVDTIAADLSARFESNPPQIVIIDGLELMGYAPGEEMDRAMLRLRQISRQHQCVVIVGLPVSHLTEKRPHHRPMVSDITISKMAESYADAILLLYRDDFYHGAESEDPGILEVAVAKNKNGSLGRVRLLISTHHTYIGTLGPDNV